MSSKSQQISTALYSFYKKPVAKVSLELFVSVLAIIFFSVFAIRPTLNTMAKLVKEIEDKKELEQQLQRKIAALATAQDEYQRSKEKIVLLDQAIPTQPLLVTSLKVIEKIAAENNVVINGVKVSDIPEEKPPTTLNAEKLSRIDLYLSLVMIGDYPSIRNFIGALHQYRRSMIVEEVKFSTDGNITTKFLRANLSIRLPYFGERVTQNAK